MKFKGRRKKSHLLCETGDEFIAVEMSLDSEYRIVVNAGRRTFQGEETESSGVEEDKQECGDAQKAGSRSRLF